MGHVEDDELAAIYCVIRELKECKKLVRCDGVTYVKANGLWSNDDALVDAFLLDLITGMDISFNNPSGSSMSSSGTPAIATKLRTSVKSLILLEDKFKSDYKFKSKAWESNKSYLCFINGIYGFKVGITSSLPVDTIYEFCPMIRRRRSFLPLSSVLKSSLSNGSSESSQSADQWIVHCVRLMTFC